MPKFIFLKSLIRKPVKSILIFGIIFLMTFFFIARAAEYCGLYFGTKELSDYYRPIGSLNYADGNGTASVHIIKKRLLTLLSQKE